MNKKTVLIAGAGGVLGTALAHEFASAEYAVIGVRRPNAPREPGEPFSQTYYCNLHAQNDMQEIVDQVMLAHGSVDVLIYNAAHLVMKPFMELKQDDFESAWQA